MGFLERRFRLTEAGTSVRTEVTGGLVTFVSLSYILFVQPAMLGSPVCGMDPGGVLFATCVASGVACLVMGLFANLPIALAPAMGHNVFFAFVVCGTLGYAWQEALAANLLAGATFLALSATRLRERVMDAIPASLRVAIAAGIGLLIAFVGLQWGGLVADHPVTLVQLGDLSHPVALLSLFGLALAAVLVALGVRAALLLAVGASALVGLAAGSLLDLERPLVTFHGIVGAPPSPAGTALELDLAALLARPLGDWLTVVSIFLVLDLFDSVGTLVGVGERAGLVVGGKLPRASQALVADASGTTLGAALGTSTVTSYVESAAGVSAGARTGLAAVVVGLLLFASLVLTPLVESIGAGVNLGTAAEPVLRYPLIAPVLILVGSLMIAPLRRVAWDDPVEAIPAFLTVLVTQVSFSITDGIAWGFIASSLLRTATGRWRSVSPLAHGIAVLFVLRYAFLGV